MKIGSSTLKQRAQLRTTAPSNEWFRNVIKSVGYASADIIKETIPSTFEFVESNGRDALDLYQQLKEDGPKSITRMLSDGVEKNEYIKIANDTISNMKEDIKSGKFYNKEREERAILGDEGMDFVFGDDDEDFSFGDVDDEEIDTEIGESSVTNVKKVTVNNINANITKNNPMVQSLEKQSEVMVGLAEATNKTNVALTTTSLSLTSRVASDLMTGISSVNDNLSALVNFNNDSMSKYVAASLQYYEDSLGVLKQTLEFNMKPALENKQAEEDPDIFLGNGGLNIKNYVGRVKKNVKTTIESDLLMNSIYGMVSDTDTIKMLAANPLKAIPMAVSKVIIPGVVRESAKQFDESMSAFFPAMLQRFNRMANQDDNWIIKTIGQIFGYNPKASTSIEIDKYHKGDMSFNGITQKAITEVIPTYLRKILSAVSGGNEMLFDYQKGKFVDYMEAKDNKDKDFRDAAFSSMEMYSELKSRLNAIEFSDEKYKKEMMSEFDNLMYKLARSGGGVNPNIRRDKDGVVVDELKDMYNSQFTEIFRSAILSLNSSEQMKLMGSDLFNAKTAYGKKIDEAQKDIGMSLIPVLEAWDSSEDYKKNEKVGTYTKKDPFGQINKDKFGKTTLDYLREMRNILLEGVTVFNAGGSGRGKNRVPINNGPSSEIFEKRRKRLDEVGQEDSKQKDLEQEENSRVIKSYSPSDISRKQSKGIKVVDSTSDILSEMNNDQMVDLFKNYVQIRDADEEADKLQKNAGNWIHKILSKGGKKVQNARDFFDNVLSLPGRVVSNVLNELDGGLYKLVFGVNPDGSDRSFLSKVTTSIKESFGGFFDWTKEKFFKPINEALFGEEGFFTKIKKSEAMEKLKKLGSKMADWSFGELDENGHRRNGAFSDAFNQVADIGKDVGSVFTGKEYVDRNGVVHAANPNSVFGNVNGFTSEVLKNGGIYLFGNKERTKPDQVQQMTIDEYMASVAKKAPETKEEPKIQTPENEQLDLFNQDGNGGESIFDKVKSWLKDNVKLRYKVSTDESEGEAKTISVGESVNDESAKGGFAPTMVNGFPYFSQRDPRYANYAYNLSTGKGGGDSLSFADRGCGPAALAMVASGMGVDADPIDMANLATETGYSVEGGTKGSFFSSIGNKLGLNVKEKQTDESKVNSAVREGKPIIFRGRKTTDNMTPFTSEGHFVVGVGGKNGKININDPNGTMTSGEYDIKDIVSESNKMWTFDDTGKGGNNTGKGPSVTTKPKNLGVGNWVQDVAKDETLEVKGVVGELVEGFQSAGQDMISLLFGERRGDEDDETKAKKFGIKFREMLPKGIAGGIIGGGLGTVVAATNGMGLLGSLFLPGGPVGAAVLGTAVGLASQSEKFKNWLFGEKDPEDTTKRLGGFISEKSQKFFKDNKSVIIGGAALGGLKGVIGGGGMLSSLLFGGPLTGAIIGAGIGLATRSERFQNMIFGKDDPETGEKIGGMLSKSYNAISDHKKQIGGAGIGLLGGAAAGTVLSSMGILGSAFFLGPVGGAIAGAGLGIAAASEKWRDRVFGTMNEDTNKREGGLLQDVKQTIVNEVLEPIKLGAIETADSFKFWFEEKVILPVADFFGPMKTAMSMMFQDTLWVLQDIGAGVKAKFQKYVGEPMNQFMHDKIFDPMKNMFGFLWKGATKVTQTILGAPFGVLGMANKGAASFVESRAKKRQAKSNDAAAQMQIYEERMANGPLSLEDQIAYETLKKKRDRYFIAEDDKRLTARTNYDENLKARKADIAERRKSAKEDLDKRKADLLSRNEFRKIFGSEYEYNEEALTKYKSLFSIDDGKKVKGRRAKKALANKADEFIRNFKSSGEAPSNEDVKDMKDEIKENLSPMRKSLMAIDNNIQTMVTNIQNGLNSIINRMLSQSGDESTMIGTANKNLKKTVRGVKRFGKGVKHVAVRTGEGVKYVAQETAEVVKDGVGYVADGVQTAVDTTVQGAKQVAGKVVDVADNVTNSALHSSESKLDKAMKEKERLKAERQKIKSGEGSGGRKDPSWLMYGKGDEKEEDVVDKPKKKKGGFLASLGSSMFSALKRFDKVNDKEEEEKAEEKETKSKLADKQKDVSSKNYSFLKGQLDAKKKEEEEKNWKNNLLNAVIGVRDKTQEHTSNWSDIFSKKGLITAGLLLALPKILEFLKDPAAFIKDAITNLISNIKISIDWLFGKGNEGRTDANGETIENGGLQDAVSRLTRNSVMTGARYLAKDGTVGNKIVKAGTKIGKGVYNTGKEFVQHLTVSDGARQILEAGYKGSDGLLDLGVKSADDLLELGVKNASDLAALGLKNSDELAKVGITSTETLAKFGVKSTKDLATIGLKNPEELAKVGIKTTDDIANFGVDIASKKASKQLSKVGTKLSTELMDSHILADGTKKTLSGVATGAKKALGEAATGVVSAINTPVSQVASKTTSAIVEAGRKATNSKFVTTITTWITEVFSSKAVRKQIGESAADKSLKEILNKVSKALSDTVLSKFATKISLAIGKTTGRVSTAAATLGIGTAAFAVADFISGAVNTERLFEIPAGTATWEMETISALLQTALGLGMVGPIIDVANEIIAEVTGINLLSMIAVTIYKFFVSEDDQIELSNLQAELDAAYVAYKEVNDTPELTKRAYIDLTNPSFGTKVMNGAKSVGNALTGNFFNTDKIRQTLGKEEGEKVTISDRVSQLTGSVLGTASFGLINGDNVTKNVANGLNSAKQWASNGLSSAKQFGSNALNSAKQFGSNAITATKQFGSNALSSAKEFGSKAINATKNGAKTAANFLTMNTLNDDEIRRQLGLNENVEVNLGDRLSMGASELIERLSFGMLDSEDTIKKVKGIQLSIEETALNVWDSAKKSASEFYEARKKDIAFIGDGLGKMVTAKMGLLDEDGNPLPLGEGMSKLKVAADTAIKNKIDDIKNTASETWSTVKGKVSEVYTDTKNKIDFAKNFAGLFITNSLGLLDEEGNPLPFSEGMSVLKTEAMTNIKNNIANVKTNASNLWEGTKTVFGDWYTETTDNISKGIDAKNKELGAFFGFKDDEGNDISLTEGITLGTSKVAKFISDKVTGITDTVTGFWKSAGQILSDGLSFITDAIKGVPDAINKFFGGLIGFKDESGEPMKLTEGIKQGWTTVTQKLSSWLNTKEEKANENTAARNAAAEISVTTNGNGGYGGFGEEMPQNIGARGCGPTAMAMVTSRITGAAVDPVMMSNLATQGGFAGSYGTNGAYFNYAANQFGISSTESKTTSQNLTQALSSGQPVILRGQSNGEKDSAFTRAGHYVVAVGAKDGKVIINDPRGEQYSGAYNMSDVVNQSNVMWSFGNARGAYNRGTSIVFGGASTNTVPGELILQYALIHKDKPYVWGGNGPKNFDCSGLVNYVCKQAGLKLPSSRPTAETWRKYTSSISKNDLKVGDLGFVVKNGKATHVGIYAGDGLWCHAEGGPGENGAGGSVVLNARTYWTHYGRIPGVSGNTTSYSETSGVSSLSFSDGTSTGTSSMLTNIAGYLSDVFTNGVNGAISGQVGTFKTYSEYMASNNSSSSSSTSSESYTDTIGAVSLGSRKTTADLLNKSLGGRLSGKGSTIVSIGNKYGVDPAFLAAVMHHESGNGTSSAIINKNNPGGIMDASSGWSTLKTFSTLDQGIDYTASNLKRNYLDQGLTTISKIGAKYAPVGASNDPNGLNNYWTSNVSTLYNKYSSDTGYGGFGDGFAPVSGYGGFGEGFAPVTGGIDNGFTFGDKMSELGGMGDYIRTTPTNQMDFSNNESDDKVVGVMETMVEVLKTIAENTGATNSNIRDAMSTAINKISTSNSNVSVNNVTTNGNKIVKTSSNYSAKETANRSIAEKIAAGKFA